jgi:hypothetical protein
MKMFNSLAWPTIKLRSFPGHLQLRFDRLSKETPRPRQLRQNQCAEPSREAFLVNWSSHTALATCLSLSWLRIFERPGNECRLISRKSPRDGMLGSLDRQRLTDVTVCLVSCSSVLLQVSWLQLWNPRSASVANNVGTKPTRYIYRQLHAGLADGVYGSCTYLSQCLLLASFKAMKTTFKVIIALLENFDLTRQEIGSSEL